MLLFVIKPHFMNVNITVSSPQNEYMKDDFMIKIETWHKPDMGSLENVSETFLCFLMF